MVVAVREMVNAFINNSEIGACGYSTALFELHALRSSCHSLLTRSSRLVAAVTPDRFLTPRLICDIPGLLTPFGVRVTSQITLRKRVSVLCAIMYDV